MIGFTLSVDVALDETGLTWVGVANDNQIDFDLVLGLWACLFFHSTIQFIIYAIQSILDSGIDFKNEALKKKLIPRILCIW
jgi:hypothetical protein